MRGLGAILFFFGILLCVSVVGSVLGGFLVILGFFMMVLGGGRRKVIINNVVNVNSPTASPPTRELPKASFWKKAPRVEPQLASVPQFALAPPEPTHERSFRTINPDAYDKAKWRALVEYDPDISRVEAALSPYGQKYVDQLAKAYLALNDKDYLPMIVQKIIATARDDSRQQRAGR